MKTMCVGGVMNNQRAGQQQDRSETGPCDALGGRRSLSLLLNSIQLCKYLLYLLHCALHTGFERRAGAGQPSLRLRLDFLTLSQDICQDGVLER